jgi:glutaminyl-peptide cyclotransferase
VFPAKPITAMFLLYLVVNAVTPGWANAEASPQTLTWQLVESYPHAPAAFTQGLELHGGRLYESSGLYGYSRLLSRSFPPVRADKDSLRGVALPKSVFAEGLTIYRGKVYLLTWRAGKGLIIDPAHFGLLGQFAYDGEGWGLCFHSQLGQFVLSDGSDVLKLYDPDGFNLSKQIRVHDAQRGYDHLNELECRGRYILANRWKHNTVLVIDAADGRVAGELDFSKLVAQEQASWTERTLPTQSRAEAVLNGIAYDPGDDSWLIGGKLWRHIYRVKLTLPEPATNH